MKKKSLKIFIAGVILTVSLVLLVGCGNETSDKGVVLEIKYEGKTKEYENVKVGDTFGFEDYGMSGQVTIENINNNKVNVKFDTMGIVKLNPGGGINLTSKEYIWSDEINYNSEYKIGVQVMDVHGGIWTLIFKK
jgi:hypothetical protein